MEWPEAGREQTGTRYHEPETSRANTQIEATQMSRAKAMLAMTVCARTDGVVHARGGAAHGRGRVLHRGLAALPRADRAGRGRGTLRRLVVRVAEEVLLPVDPHEPLVHT